MRRVYISTFLLILIIGVSISLGFAGKDILKTVDMTKIKKSAYTTYIEHIKWPQTEQIKNKKISKNISSEDIGEFEDMLEKVIRSEYLPSEKEINSNIFGIENFKDNNDYLFLKYKSNKFDIEIQDGKALYVLVSPVDNSTTTSVDLKEYVHAIAHSILNIPALDKDGKAPTVFESIVDIGNSKCGDISYESDIKQEVMFWYSRIGWWSNGSDALFVISKIPSGGLEIGKMATTPPELKAPRKFKKKDNQIDKEKSNTGK